MAAPGVDTAPADGDERKLRYRAIWISDLHLGTLGCQAAALLDLLRRIESDHLYLVGVVQYARWLAVVGDVLYALVLKLNRHLNVLRARVGLPYWSRARYVKPKVKNSVNYMCAFEQAVAHEARQRSFDGVVCGHIYRAEVREIDGTLYCNDGDWVESLCALVEQEDGRLAIVHWHELAGLLTLGEGWPAQRPVEADVAVARG